MKFRRAMARVLLVAGGLTLALGLLVVFALSSPPVAKRVVAFALGRTARGLEIGEIRGTLRGPLVLLRSRYRAGSLSATVDSALLDWHPLQLLKGRLEFSRLHLTGVHLIIPDSTPPDTSGTARARRVRPVAPLPVVLGDAYVSGLTIDAPGGVTLRNGMVSFGGRLQDYNFALTGDATAPRLGGFAVHLTGQGSLEDVVLKPSTVHLSAGSIGATGQVRWWPRLGWDLAVAVDSLEPALLLELPAWPGRLRGWGATEGSIDEGGLAGSLRIDSLSGILRRQPLGGRAQLGFSPAGFTLENGEVAWGSVRLRAEGTWQDEVALSYDLIIGDLRTILPGTRGRLEAHGTVAGRSGRPRLAGRLSATRLASGRQTVTHVQGPFDLDLAPNGRLAATLQAEGAAVAGMRWSTASLGLEGTHRAHRVVLAGRSAADSLRLVLAGGLTRGVWRGSLAELAVRDSGLGGWRLDQPAGLIASRSSGRLERMCLLTAGAGRLCGEADWRATRSWSPFQARSWNALATLEQLPLDRLPLRAFAQRPGRRVALTGTVGGTLEAHAVGGRIRGTLRAAADSAALVYQDGGEREARRLALDSAVVVVSSEPTGTVAQLDLRVSDSLGSEPARLTGRLTLPELRQGRRLAVQPMELSVDGRIPDLRLLQPLIALADSLRGSAVLALAGSGSLAAPRLKGSLAVSDGVAGLRGQRTVRGSAVLAVDGEVEPDRSLTGELSLTPSGVSFGYRYFGEPRRIQLDSGAVVLRAGPEGLEGTLTLGASEAGSTRTASLSARLELPGYTRTGLPLASQPVALELQAEVPDLRLLQPFTLKVDSLAGRLSFAAQAGGRVGTPSLHGTLELSEGAGRFEPGTWVRGGLSGRWDFTTAGDRALAGTLRIEPRDVRFDYPVGSGRGLTRVAAASALEVSAGPGGVRTTLDAAFQDTTGATLGTLRGAGALPGFTHLGQRLAPQPLTATLRGDVADLAFLEAFTSHVDSAAGSLALNAKVDGTVGDTRMVGDFTLDSVALRLPPYGLLLEDVHFTGRGDGSGAITLAGRARSGGGELTISGRTPVQPTSSQPGRLEIKGQRFEAMNNNELHAVVSPDLTVRIAGDSVEVRGRLDLPLARVMLADVPADAVAPSDDIILLDSVLVRGRPVTAEVRLTLGDSVSFSGFNFDAELGGSLLLVQDAGRVPTASGTLRIEEGTYRAYGQDLHIQNGEIRFAGGSVDNPGLAIRAVRVAPGARDSVVAGLQIAGTLKEPQVALFSEPPMSQTQVLSYLLTGSPLGGGSGSEGSFVNKVLTSLGLKGGNLLTRSVGAHLGLEEARLQTESDVKETSLRIGRFLSPNLYVSYGIGLFDPVSTLRLRYVLSSRFTLLAEAGGRATSADVLLKTEGGKKP